MNAVAEPQPVVPQHPNRIIELAGQLDSRPESSMTKSERQGERKKMIGSYREYLMEIDGAKYVVRIENQTNSIWTHIARILGRKGGA